MPNQPVSTKHTHLHQTNRRQNAAPPLLGASAALVGRAQVDTQHENAVLDLADRVADDGEVAEIDLRLLDEPAALLTCHRW